MSSKRSVGWERVTPDMASNWLGESVNDANRHIRRRKVEQYARDMAAGKWTESNDAITFDEDGKLLNGQHRLSAIVKNGKAVELLVARGVPRAAQLSMDTGAGRTLSDHLHMAEGMTNTGLISAGARMMLLFENASSTAKSLSRQELYAWVTANPGIQESADFASVIKKKIDAPGSAITAAHFMISQVNGPELAELYLNKLAVPAGEEEGSAIFAVISRLRSARDERVKPSAQAVLLVRGWNKWVAGEKVRVLYMPNSETLPPKIARRQAEVED